MKKLNLAAAIAISLAAAQGASAATLVAGWDFSQFLTDSVLSIDGASAAPQNIVANYSNFESANVQGIVGVTNPPATPYGEMQLPFVPLADGSEPFLPIIGSLSPNITLPQPLNNFDNFTALAIEGQLFQNPLSMMAVQNVSVVFMGNIPGVGTDWQITLAARTIPGLSSGTITLEFSADGSAYASIGSFSVTGTAAAFSSIVNSIPSPSDKGFFRLNIGQGVVIDNVGILANVAVPEPATASMLGMGLLGLLALGKRRRA